MSAINILPPGVHQKIIVKARNGCDVKGIANCTGLSREQVRVLLKTPLPNNEVLRELKEQPGFWISNMGVIYGYTGKQLKAWIRNKIYGPFVPVYLERRPSVKPIHLPRAMLKYFNGERGKDYVYHHLDGNKMNNNINNLVWLPKAGLQRDTSGIDHVATIKATLTPHDIELICQLSKEIPVQEISKKFEIPFSTTRWLLKNHFFILNDLKFFPPRKKISLENLKII